MPYGTVNADVIQSSVANTSLGAGNASIMKNRIINGAMVIDQRNAGASVTPTDGSYTLDRWRSLQSVASKYSVQQNAGSVTPPAGFSNYLGVTSLSAYTVGASDIFSAFQVIEGFNTADLDFGKSTAKTITVSFWVRSSLTGTFGGSLRNQAANRSYPFTYTINSANTWEYETITIAGDTSGTWVGATNSAGLYLFFGLGVGTTSSGTAGAWAAGNYVSATGATSVVGTNGATFYITGVQLEVGSSATGFEYRQYQQELTLCQRYGYAVNGGYTGYANGTTIIDATVNCPVQMRAAPTATTGTLLMTSYGGTGASTQSSASFSIPSAGITQTGGVIRFLNFASLTSGSVYNVTYSTGSTTAYAGFLSAEL